MIKRMKFDIYGRLQLEVTRESDRWAVYRLGLGRRTLDTELVLPPGLEPNDIKPFLADLFHEYAVDGKTVNDI